ncbi:hypothetical protein [Bacillus velezensis]|uniref:hypothetical protein n=1 Tax=Bacillus velezensis TaxID=492670 RepID=UPI001628F475|nr:hypothetical protein [Bacillus velezensis]MBC2596640.1 hypothetical protein [Bacillus velezensis]
MPVDFELRDDLKRFISIGTFKAFAKEKLNEYRGNKDEVIEIIVNAVKNEQLPIFEFRDFIKEQLWYGKNKHIYFVNYSGGVVQNFRDLDYLLRYMNDNKIKKFNDLDLIDLPDTETLARFEYDIDSVEENKVERVYIGYVEKNYLYEVVENRTIFKPINNYVCVEIDLIKKMMILNIRSQNKLKIDDQMDADNITSNYIAKKYLDKFCEEFSTVESDFDLLDGSAEEIKYTMYNIEKSLTSFIEHQFRPEIEKHREHIKEFTTSIAELLDLESDEEPIDLYGRILGLLERALISKNENVIRQYQSGKKGFIEKFDFVDDKGGRINARSDERNKPIQTSDIFFDTRETINEVKLINSLWVTWFMPIKLEAAENIQLALELDESDLDDDTDGDIETEIDDGNVLGQESLRIIVVPTKIMSYRGFYKVIFSRYLKKEEYNYVLSIIESFKE